MVCKGSKEPKIKQLHLLILGFQKSYLFCLLCNIVSPLMMPHVWTLTTPCESQTWRINSCKHGCWIMKINSIVKTKTSISKLYNYLSTLLIINQPFMLYELWWYEKQTSKILLKYWANFPSDLDNFSLSASIMYQNWWIKFKANPTDKNKRSKQKRKTNIIKLQF